MSTLYRTSGPRSLMRILFDNGAPRQLRSRLFGHVVEEAREHGWDGLSNGDLLDRAEEAGFEVLITTDQAIRYQQNMSNRQGGGGRLDEHRMALHIAPNGSRPKCP